ncbi:MAG TPA: beta-ketoacyl-[acyl-carrier-protein] synthase family protein [Planctomycetota bacterium]|nr:beta-ketoacyl-[acyl-carrier-protein] synthase family protein [Planctomycetota bacterium]
MNRVGITGFGVVSPIGVAREAFWQSLADGRGGIGPITRFDCSAFSVRLAGEVKQRAELPAGDRVDAIDGIDAIAATAATAGVAADDPKVGFALAACAEALGQAGIASLTRDTLLHLGVSLEAFDMQKAICGGRPDFRSIAERSMRPGAPPLQIPLDTASRLIARRFGVPGRSLTNCSACAAGAQAIGHAFRCVRAGRCAAAVCGGLDSMINPLGVGGFQMLGALTTDNARGESACRPFDASRSGTVLGEGAAVVVLEPLDAARAAGKRVLAEVCGYGSTLDAWSLSAPDPEGDGAARAMLAALDDAGIRAEQIAHINAHGTATRVNDEVEAAAIRRVFARTWQRIPVSSTKSMTGHLIAAAGAVEVGACLLALVMKQVPPNPFLNSVGQGCELAHVGHAAVPFDGEYVMSNSFGFGGQNVSLVLRRCDG